MRLTYDDEVRAYYAHVDPTKRIKSTHPLSDTVMLDVDADGNVVGFEILDADFCDLPTIEQI